MKQIMTSVALAFAAIALTAGCGGSQKTSTMSVPTCEDAAANNERVIIAMGKAQGQDMTAYATAGREVYAERCPADRWSSDIIACAAGAADADAMIACVEQLPPEQHKAMVDAFEAKMGGSGGGAEGASQKSAPPDDPCGGGQ